MTTIIKSCIVNGKLFRIGDVIMGSTNLNILVKIKPTTFNVKKLFPCNRIYADLYIDGVPFNIGTFTHRVKKKKYQTVHPDSYRLSLRVMYDLPPTYQIPNQNDKFECHMCESCCIEKDWKVYTRQQYIEHLNDLLSDLRVGIDRRIEYDNALQTCNKIMDIKYFIIDFHRNDKSCMDKIEEYSEFVQLVRHE